MPKQWVEARKTICIDYNGVLDVYAGWKGPDYIYPARQGARPFLEYLKSTGWTVVVLSSADPINVHKFLITNGLAEYVDRVTNEKVPALIYLDDRGITFKGSFTDAIHQIENFKTFWETPEVKEGGKV